MKSIDEITRLSAEDLERISLDESIPVPEELSGKVQEAVQAAGAQADRRRWVLPPASPPPSPPSSPWASP